MPDEPAILPQEENSQAPNVTINQFIQLVNQSSSFPDASTLDSYKQEDKEWIKRRTEIEQQVRHQLINKLLDHDHTQAMAVTGLQNRNRQHSQTWAGIIILGALAGSFTLLWHGLFYEGLGLLVVVMVPPVATALSEKIVKKFTSSGEERD